jgi:dihydropteroate synthase
MNRNRHIDIMGIVNLTDDSYFAQSRCADVAAAVEKVGRMLEEGATIIDIGACSTRPGSLPVGADEEWRRLKPVLKAVKEKFPEVRISVDTYWSEVVRKTYDLIGDFIVNDISAGEDDPEMLPLVGQLGLTYIAMHKRGNPENMQSLTEYDDVVADVVEYFRRFSDKAVRQGIKSWILDPGFGFAKSLEQNYEMLIRLAEFKSLQVPVLVGVSRKSMIYRLLDITPEEALPATQVLHMKALQSGADILRVHDVAEIVRTVALYRILG